MTNIKDFCGELKEIEGLEHKVHPAAGADGGLDIIDDDNIMMMAFKEIGVKIAARVAKGQLGDISKIPSPSYIHHYISHHGLVKNDMTHVNFLNKAAATSDSVERMQHVISWFIANHFINPTLMQCRIPLNPILGETYQMEMPTGEKIYCE